MTAREYLNQLFRMDRRIDSKLEQLSALREMAARTTACMQDDVVSRTRNIHRMEEIIVKITDMENEINDEIDRLVDLRKEIMDVLGKMKNPQYQTLLELRYLCCKNWEEIAEIMNYTASNVFKLHKKALQAVTVPEGAVCQNTECGRCAFPPDPESCL